MLTTLKIKQRRINIIAPTEAENAILKKSGMMKERRELKKEVTATDGIQSKIIIKRFFIILTSILSFRLSIMIFKIAVIAVLIPIPKGSDNTPIYPVRQNTEMKVNIPPII